MCEHLSWIHNGKLGCWMNSTVHLPSTQKWADGGGQHCSCITMLCPPGRADANPLLISSESLSWMAVCIVFWLAEIVSCHFKGSNLLSEDPCENTDTIKFTSLPASHLPSPHCLFSTWVDTAYFFPQRLHFIEPKDRNWYVLMLIFTFSNVNLQEIHCSCTIGCQELWKLLTAFAISWRTTVITELYCSDCDACYMPCPSCRASSVD